MPKTCILCKNYLKTTEYAYSYHTSTRFRIRETVDCNSKNVIYIINDKICNVSSVGYTTDSMNVRFTNHKSHIKYNKRFCEVSKHFAHNISFHHLNKSSQKDYDNCLKNRLKL